MCVCAIFALYTSSVVGAVYIIYRESVYFILLKLLLFKRIYIYTARGAARAAVCRRAVISQRRADGPFVCALKNANFHTQCNDVEKKKRKKRKEYIICYSRAKQLMQLKYSFFNVHALDEFIFCLHFAKFFFLFCAEIILKITKKKKKKE